MAIPRFYVTDELMVDGRGALDAGQSRQVRSVLRLQTGDPIVLFNGTGVEATAHISGGTKDAIGYEIDTVATPDREPPLRLTVGLAVLKGDRFEVAIQKLTELGVTRIVPLLTERSVVSFDDARNWQKRADRYARICREAAEQSERVRLPELAAPVDLAGFLDTQPVGQPPVIVLLERAGSVPIGEVAFESDLAIAIGPEGGWSDREQVLIGERATGTATLGRLILRAETAAIVAAGTLIQRSWAEQGYGGD